MNPTREAYKTKLANFNSTEKYRSEVDFLFRLMNPKPGEKILDYGCGRGHLVWDLVDTGYDAYGHDFINYREKDDMFRFRQEYYFKFDKVFMMHSIAHIPDIEQKLVALKDGMSPGGKVYVITPNKDWIDEQDDENYKPDPTVVKHFHQVSLDGVFNRCGFKILSFGQFGNIKQYHGNESVCINERLFLEAEL